MACSEDEEQDTSMRGCNDAYDNDKVADAPPLTTICPTCKEEVALVDCTKCGRIYKCKACNSSEVALRKTLGLKWKAMSLDERRAQIVKNKGKGSGKGKPWNVTVLEEAV